MDMTKVPKIILNQNPNDQTIKILIPPMRPFNVYEIEDNFESVVREIERNVEPRTAQFAIRFFSKVKYAIENDDILPLVQYFSNENAGMQHMVVVLKMLEEFVKIARSENRIMH